jgi:hypothetical protein
MCGLLASGDVRGTGVVLRMSLLCPCRRHPNRHLPDTAKHTPRPAGCSDDSNIDIIRTLLPCRLRSETSYCIGAPVATQCLVTCRKLISRPTSPQQRTSRQRFSQKGCQISARIPSLERACSLVSDDMLKVVLAPGCACPGGYGHGTSNAA